MADELSVSIPLHRGEKKAIILTCGLKADVLLMDELDGRAAARHQGLTVLGTLGMLDLATSRGIDSRRLIDLRDAWEQLRSTSFHASSRLLAEFLARDRMRRETEAKG